MVDGLSVVIGMVSGIVGLMIVATIRIMFNKKEKHRINKHKVVGAAPVSLWCYQHNIIEQATAGRQPYYACGGPVKVK